MLSPSRSVPKSLLCEGSARAGVEPACRRRHRLSDNVGQASVCGVAEPLSWTLSVDQALRFS